MWSSAGLQVWKHLLSFLLRCHFMTEATTCRDKHKERVNKTGRFSAELYYGGDAVRVARPAPPPQTLAGAAAAGVAVAAAAAAPRSQEQQ
jgi:hypothetical protein